jgi:hypothetical protein
MEILVMVLAAALPEHERMISAIRRTWAKSPPAGVRVLFYYGRKGGIPTEDGAVVEDGFDTIYCGSDEGLENIMRKTIIAFRYALRFPFDVVFRVCSGSYVELRRLAVSLGNKPMSRFYGGVPNYRNGSPYPSGAGYFLSRDLVELVVANSDTLLRTRRETYDDIALGQFMTMAGVPFQTFGRRHDITKGARNVLEREDYHFHLPENPNGMMALHKVLTGKDPC